MTASPLANVLVTAVPPSVPPSGLPTLTGYTDSEGQVSLPLNQAATYNLAFSHGGVGSVTGFRPATATFDLHPLKNIGAQSVYVNSSLLPPGKSIAGYHGFIAVRPVPSATFKSWAPNGLFEHYLARSTTLVMPGTTTSISCVPLTGAYKLRNKGAAKFSVGASPVPPGHSITLVPGSHPITAVPASGNSFSSWNPASLFASPFSKIDTLVMPARNASVSFHSTSYPKMEAVDGYASSTLAATGLNRRYDGKANTWATRAADPTPRTYPAGSALSGKLYVTGGDSTSGTALSAHNAYDVATDTWSARAPEAVKRAEQCAGFVQSKLYVADGGPLAGLKKSLYQYDPGTNSWTKKASDSIPRADLAGGATSSSFYAIDGNLGGTVRTKATRRYDVGANTWSTRANDLISRGDVANRAPYSFPYLYVVGGVHGGSTYLSTNNRYGTTSNAWTARAFDLVARIWLTAAALSSRIHAVDGGRPGTYYSKNTAYDIATDTWASRAVDHKRTSLVGGVL